MVYRGFVLGLAISCITACSDTNTKERSLNKSANPTQKGQVLSGNIPASTPSPKPITQNLSFNPPAKFQGKTLSKVEVPNNEKVIALTFDDGPWKETTPKMLDILKQNGVKATFFWVGTALQENPEIGRQVVEDGHAIANHTFHHWYKQMDAATAKSEIERTADLIYKTTGVKTTLFRPPGGYLNNGLAGYAKSQNYAVVMWSQTSADTDPKAKYQVFIKNVLRDAKPGGIVLMHDGGGDRRRTVQALPLIIQGLKEKGYRFVTVPEILEMGN
ncbi:polysaccharide deacetylase [Brunnivagina elsteri CCALA 953]|uniref:Polysaccharide deacetylase n=2 Tax=Brunnivagina TaxID=3344733 RepID=A0A2A2TBE7_9CYAN|nr:polysaccharide deacetylase [Calothrix elsteri CCALA 953]